MLSSREFECEAATAESQGGLLHVSCIESAWQFSDVPCNEDSCQRPRPCMLSTKGENGTNGSIQSDEMLLRSEWCPSSPGQDYIEKIKLFQIYLDKVQKFTRPGCSLETLNVALSSMSSLFETLSAISSKQYMHASL